jgi:hypothetical protein
MVDDASPLIRAVNFGFTRPETGIVMEYGPNVFEREKMGYVKGDEHAEAPTLLLKLAFG